MKGLDSLRSGAGKVFEAGMIGAFDFVRKHQEPILRAIDTGDRALNAGFDVAEKVLPCVRGVRDKLDAWSQGVSVEVLQRRRDEQRIRKVTIE